MLYNEFEVGDIVKISTKTTLADLFSTTCWRFNVSVPKFITEAVKGKMSSVYVVEKTGYDTIKVEDYSMSIPVEMFELVAKAEPKVLEVTMADLEKKYGCKVKVVK